MIHPGTSWNRHFWLILFKKLRNFIRVVRLMRLMVRLCRVHDRWKCSCVVRFVVVCLVDVYFCFWFCFHFTLIWLLRSNLLLWSHTLLLRSCCASGCTVSARVCYVWLNVLFVFTLTTNSLVLSTVNWHVCVLGLNDKSFNVKNKSVKYNVETNHLNNL